MKIKNKEDEQLNTPKTHTLKKSVGAVHSAPLNYLTLVQRKLINVCIFHAYNNLKTDSEHRIHIDLLHLYFCYTGNNWQAFNEAFEALQRTIFVWNIFDECTTSEKISWERVPLLSKVAWDSESREFIYKFGDGLVEKFHFPSRYVVLTLNMQSKFTTPYSLVLYEQCARYATNKNGTRWFDINQLRNILAVGNKYEKFKDFNAWVLKPAISEINELTDLSVSPLFKREKHAISQIKFNVEMKNESDNLISNDESVCLSKDELDIRDALIHLYGVVPRVAESMIKEFGLGRIKDSIQYVQSTSTYKKKKTPNLAGYIVKAIKENYKSNQQIQSENMKSKLESDYSRQQLVKFGENIKLKYENTKKEIIENYIKEMNLLDDKKFINLFYNDNEKDIKMYTDLFKQRKKDIFSIEPIRVAFRNYVLKNIKEVSEKVIGFSEYIKGLTEGEKFVWDQYIKLH